MKFHFTKETVILSQSVSFASVLNTFFKYRINENKNETVICETEFFCSIKLSLNFLNKFSWKRKTEGPNLITFIKYIEPKFHSHIWSVSIEQTLKLMPT